MWQKYKSAIITGVVLCCIIFFGLGYCVGNTGRGYHGGIQNTGFQSMENGNKGMRPDGRNQWNKPDTANPQNPTDDDTQNNEGSQTAPDSNQTTPDPSVYLFGETNVF